ncbi:hypothetical protein JR316_0000626 [Psilocybe cubensis]|uniref:Uncharacterized protein n=2 Tax=Psilocybe cubensis TaxID=181762 RepID=A0ACB8HF54_PSICU|nr:hypothetical protein JR316_0000626 [Psilocybe cubensis]KAH9486561.1 hypothetical protein JR316_0000626 [Psilocybe cubensis]
MNLRQVVFHDHRNTAFISLSLIVSALAVRPDSTILPLIGINSILLVYSPFLFRADKLRTRNVILTWFALSIGSVFSRLHASIQALSTPGGSLAALFFSSGTLSAITLTTLFFGTKYQGRPSLSPWSRVTIFPALWATTWCTISHLNPVGHLATWSAAQTNDAYGWLIPFIGPAGRDWIIAAWAVVIAQIIGSWYIGPLDPFEFGPIQQDHTHDNIPATGILALSLFSLAVPSYVFNGLPLPASGSTLDISTPLTVGCVLPPYDRYHHHVLTLDDYIAESSHIQSQAKLILWPEGAVTFNSIEERENAFSTIREKISGSYVGVSFEETISDPDDPTDRTPITQTGLAVISQYSPEPHHIYYKRNLVPFAESFRLRHSKLPPSIFDFRVPNPKAIRNRTIPITSSICLDFAQPHPFAELDSRPALILAPARTWDRTVGYAMWMQAKQRAEELDSMVLWCDGGEGGVSGVAGRGYSDVSQVGQGSFIRTVGIQYPFNNQATPFARFGDSILLLFWFSVYGFALFGRPLSMIGRRIQAGALLTYGGAILPAVRYIQNRRVANGQAEAAPQPNLELALFPTSLRSNSSQSKLAHSLRGSLRNLTWKASTTDLGRRVFHRKRVISTESTIKEESSTEDFHIITVEDFDPSFSLASILDISFTPDAGPSQPAQTTLARDRYANQSPSEPTKAALTPGLLAPLVIPDSLPHPRISAYTSHTLTSSEGSPTFTEIAHIASSFPLPPSYNPASISSLSPEARPGALQIIRNTPSFTTPVSEVNPASVLSSKHRKPPIPYRPAVYLSVSVMASLLPKKNRDVVDFGEEMDYSHVQWFQDAPQRPSTLPQPEQRQPQQHHQQQQQHHHQQHHPTEPYQPSPHVIDQNEGFIFALSAAPNVLYQRYKQYGQLGVLGWCSEFSELVDNLKELGFAGNMFVTTRAQALKCCEEIMQLRAERMEEVKMQLVLMYLSSQVARLRRFLDVDRVWNDYPDVGIPLEVK